MSQLITIINYGLGNVLSIQNMLKKIGHTNVLISDDFEVLKKSDKLILPGVGHFEKGMNELEKRNLISKLNKFVIEDKKPILGICLGMQLMTHKSDEGNSKGLGWIDAETKVFKFETDSIKVPHMGWNEVNLINNNFFKIEIENNNTRFYFVHSYFVKCNNETNSLFQTNYGEKTFDSGFINKNIMGVQFHPEKSHLFGMEFFRKFISWEP